MDFINENITMQYHKTNNAFKTKVAKYGYKSSKCHTNLLMDPSNIMKMEITWDIVTYG
jgi:uncharacterized protein YcgI (DUF1989 family)